MSLPRCRSAKHETADQSLLSARASISFGNRTRSLRCKARSRRDAKSCAVIDDRATVVSLGRKNRRRKMTDRITAVLDQIEALSFVESGEYGGCGGVCEWHKFPCGLKM